VNKLLAILLISYSSAFSQDSIPFWKKHLELSGYLKFMQTFNGNSDGTIYDQSLWHNRINTKLFNYSEKGGSEFYVEVRNRIFYGEGIRRNSLLSDALDLDQGNMDLSFVIGKESSFLYSVIFDRLWYKGYYKDWEWSFGRQRINWGINTYWNANDIFNAFTFTDFDYEERPGSDAVRVQKYFSNGSDIELAASLDFDASLVLATKYSVNLWNYDFQFIGGVYHDDLVFGGGWAGGIKKWGFKGEANYFLNSYNKDLSTGSISMSGEYLLKNNSFFGLGGLYSSNGIANEVDISTSLLVFQTSAKALMPTRWSAMATLGGEINGLTNYALVIVFMPGINYALLMPSISRSVAQNIDLSFHMINVSGFLEDELLFLSNGFVRAKWSF
jgi:hypothetical protein